MPSTYKPVAWVLAGIVVLVALIRYQRNIAGWVLLSLVLLLALVATQKGIWQQLGG